MPPTVVLLPGLLCTSRVWSHAIGALQRAYNVIIPDVTRHTDIRQQAKDILADLPTRDPVSVCGFSYGGYLALAMCAHAPERIARLGLVSSQARPDSAQTRARRMQQIEWAQADRSVARVIRSQIPLLLHAAHVPPPDALDDMIRSAAMGKHTHDAAQRYAACWDAIVMAQEVGPEAFVRQQQAIMSRQDCRHALARLGTDGMPLLVVASASDMLIPTAAQLDMAAVARGHRAHHGSHAAAHTGSASNPDRTASVGSRPVIARVVSATSGHFVPVEQPTDVQAALLEWMQLPERSLRS